MLNDPKVSTAASASASSALASAVAAVAGVGGGAASSSSSSSAAVVGAPAEVVDPLDLEKAAEDKKKEERPHPRNLKWEEKFAILKNAYARASHTHLPPAHQVL